MAAGSTYTPIATTTLGSAQATVTLSSIPSTYTDLVVVCANLVTNANGLTVGMYYNSNNSNYSNTYVLGNGSTASSGRNTYTTKIGIGYAVGLGTGNPSDIICQIQNYANTSVYKTALMRFNISQTSTGEVGANVGLWRDTSAINAITFDLNDGAKTFTAGSTFTLYGIAAA
jgi:hypothetical protein